MKEGREGVNGSKAKMKGVLRIVALDSLVCDL